MTFAVDGARHILYAADDSAGCTNPKVYVSRDLGATWSVAAGYLPYANQYVRKMVIATNGNLVLTGHWNGTIFVSTDAGASCIEADQPGTSGGTSNGTSGWGYVGVNPVTGEIWAGLETGGKWVSTDNGLTFTQCEDNGFCVWYSLGPIGNTYAFGYDLTGAEYEGGNHGPRIQLDQHQAGRHADVHG